MITRMIRMYNCNSEVDKLKSEFNVHDITSNKIHNLIDNGNRNKFNIISDVVFVDTKSIDKTDTYTIDTICNLSYDKYTISPTENPVVDVPNRLNEKNVHNYVILTKDPTKLSKQFPNNIIDLTEQNVEKIKKNINWILTNFGKDKNMSENKIWLVSDNHFNHENIIRYCNRPFKSAEEMTEQMIYNWNSVVGKNDIVWNLGDFCLGPNQKETIPSIVSRLNGKINLVCGNHDHHNIKFYYECGFNRVYDRNVIINSYIILSHSPIGFINENCPFFNCYGHVHDSDMYKTISKSGCCVCVERWNYTPVALDHIKLEYEKILASS